MSTFDTDFFEIIDQQIDFVVINKKPGVNFHDESDLGKGLFNQVKTRLKTKDQHIENVYPVHRLDKMTSGLILFATNLTSAQQFQQLFSNHNIEKFYLAISDQKPKKKQGLIIGDMEKSRRGSWKLLRTQNNPAISQFFSYPLTPGKRLYLIKPHSGKSHQIRVALSSVGAPIIGDSRYHTSSIADRGYLHAYALSFELHGHKYQYVLPPQQGQLFTEQTTQNKLTELSAPWQLAWPKV